MKWSPTKTIIMLSLIGLLIAPVKLIYSFLPFFNILDIVIFLGIGYVLGGKVSKDHWQWGLLLAFPAFALSAFFVNNLGIDLITSGVGTGWAISTILLPSASCIGIAFGGKRALRNNR